MDMTSQNPAGFTNQPVAEVFAAVAKDMQGALAKVGHSAEQIEHFIGQLNATQHHEQWNGKSATAIRAGLEKLINTVGRAHDAGANVAGFKPDLTRITSEQILGSLPNVTPKAVVSEVRDNVVEILKNRAANAKPAAVVKAPHHSRFGGQDYLWMGLTALTAGMSIYAAISNYFSVRQAQQVGEDGVKQAVPLSAYIIPSAQMALGVGMALIAHNHYKNPTGASL